MSSADERSFVGAIVKEAHTVLVNGPQWPSPAAPLVDPPQLAGAETYLLIWNKSEVPRLSAKRSGAYWEAYNEKTTIQFLRCQLWDESVLTEGRIAISTEDKHIQRRYQRLRQVIRQTCRNGLVCWLQPAAPRTAKNPSAPDRQVWVGPDALNWLRCSARHAFKQDRHGLTQAIICETDSGNAADQRTR
jgi:hypothetical protein